MKTAHKLSRAGANVVGVPKTIDNDVWGTDQSFGFDSAPSRSPRRRSTAYTLRPTPTAVSWWWS